MTYDYLYLHGPVAAIRSIHTLRPHLCGIWLGRPHPSAMGGCNVLQGLASPVEILYQASILICTLVRPCKAPPIIVLSLHDNQILLQTSKLIEVL